MKPLQALKKIHQPTKTLCLASALRVNLVKRKQQMRARQAKQSSSLNPANNTLLNTSTDSHNKNT